MGAPISFSPREQLVALIAHLPKAKRSAWIGGLVFALGLAATAVWVLSARRLYRSEAVVVYEPGVRTASADPEGESATAVGSRVQDMLSSRQRLEAIIKEMNLYPEIAENKGMAEAVDEMRRRLKLPSREGYIFRVTYDSEGRELSQKVLERVLSLVIDDDRQRSQRSASEAKTFLDAERKSAEDELKTKEAALGAFLTKHPQLAAETALGANAGGMIRAADRDRMPAATGEIAALEMQLAQIEGDLAAAGVRAGSTLAPEDPLLAAARTRAQGDLQVAQTELRVAQARFTNEHPDVRAASRRVTDAEMALRRAETALATAPRRELSAAASPADNAAAGRITALRKMQQAIRSQIGALRSRSGPKVEMPKAATSVVAIDTEWTRLTREVREARDRQEQIESKQFQAQLSATLATAGQAGRLVVVDAPFLPIRPVAGGRFKLALIGGAASVLLALLAIAIAAALDDRLYAVRDVERLVADGIVVVIPRLPAKQG
jgi:uncharacterized protein involved in exopolysaccharide biosynthesis